MQELLLFTSAFLAATILPFSSEVVFVAALANDMPILNAMISASSGNILAVIVNYLLGLFLYEKMKAKLESSKIGRSSYSYGHRYGYYALALSWLPVIGDPLTIVAGLLRLNFIYFIIIAASLRILRYWFLTQAF